MLRRLAVGTAALLATLALAAPASANCPDETSTPAALTPLGARTALLCLINQERAAHGLAPLAEEPHLDKAAHGHSKAMRKGRFFGHGHVWQRIRRSGYLRGARHFGLGEALGWGRGETGDPATTIESLMASPVHRDEILSARFRDVGIGVAIGSPVTGRARNSAIYTVDFGFRI
jgi:uncharacterized protein YkwD